MCGLCSNNQEDKEMARKLALVAADKLDRMSRFYRGLANGDVSPHSNEAKGIGILARSIVRDMVDEWV